MFTRLADALLKLCVVAVLLLAIYVGTEADNFFAFVVALLGGLLILSIFGIFVELANNVLDIKKHLEKNGVGKVNTYPQTQAVQPMQANDGWYCNACGSKNTLDSSYCYGCGQPR